MRSYCALLLTLAFSSFAAAQGLDCKLAQSPREHAICASPRLINLDTSIAADYKSLRDQLSPESAAILESDQREWWQWIDLVCRDHPLVSPASPKATAEPPRRFGNLGDANKPVAHDGSSPAEDAATRFSHCLQDQYAARARDFKKTVHIGPAIIFSRAHFLYKPGDQLNKTAINNLSGPDYPGFGYGTIRWPQIDFRSGPLSPAVIAWNKAMKTRADKIGAGIFNAEQDVTFDTAVNALEDLDADYNIEAANDRLVEVSLIVSSRLWISGAAPVIIRSSFLWWFDRNRELTADDVFQPVSAWQEFLASVATGRLQASIRLKPLLREDPVLDQAVHQSAPETANWTLTRNGLTVTFLQGMVAANPAGMPSVFVSWEDLKPFLQPNLNPATLPSRLPKPNP